MTSRFLNLLKTKTIGGSSQATATELDDSADSVFLEPSNLGDILQVGHINSAIQASRQNSGLPKGSLSVVSTVSIGDSQTNLAVPSNEQVYSINAITLKNGGGSTIDYEIRLTDGTTAMVIASGTAPAGANTVIYSPIATSSAAPGTKFLITSKSYLVAIAASTLPCDLSYHVLQS